MNETAALRRRRLRMEGELRESYSVEEALEEIGKILQRHSPDCEARLYEKELEIRNGHRVRSRGDRMRVALILSRCGLTEREYDNISAEWLLHNMAYDLHFLRGSARHVALDFGKDKRPEVNIATRLLEIIGLI